VMERRTNPLPTTSAASLMGTLLPEDARYPSPRWWLASCASATSAGGTRYSVLEESILIELSEGIRLKTTTGGRRECHA
jgi:hypothetical protein